MTILMLLLDPEVTKLADEVMIFVLCLVFMFGVYKLFVKYSND